MPANRVVAAPVSGAAVPTGADTALASIAAQPAGISGELVLVRADCALIGAASVTAVTVTIHRGQTVAGAVLYQRAFTVTGAVVVAAVAAFRDSLYDGSGYTLSMQAAGAAATADVSLECEPDVGESLG